MLAIATFPLSPNNNPQSAFVHKYSGNVGLTSLFTIAGQYFLHTHNIADMSHQLATSTTNSSELYKYWSIGAVLYTAGIAGNAYHHLLLRWLRPDEKDKEYKVPKGALFEYVVCPHYLCEWIGARDLPGLKVHWSHLSFSQKSWDWPL